MKIDIHDHPALQIPHDPDSLRDLILLYIGMLREEEPFYLMHELSLPRRHIKLLKMIRMF